PATLCTMLPYRIEREPHELLPAMPPSVACALVDTSTGNHRPCARSCAFSASSTTPGCTTALAFSRSRATTLFRYLLLSMTSAAPTVCPHCELPAPRGRMGTPS